MKKDFELEERLDELLNYFVEIGQNSAIPLHTIPSHLKTRDLPKMLSILESLQYVVPMTVDYRDGKAPVTFHQILTLTAAGVKFSHESSFVEEAKRKRKENRRFNFEYFTLGWDTVIALFSLLISGIALYVSIK